MQFVRVWNTFLALLVGHVLGKTLALASASILGRTLGPSALGIYGAALTGVGYLMVVANFGQDATGIRLVSLDPSHGRAIRRSVFRIRLVAGMAGVAGGCAVTVWQDWPLSVSLPLLASILVYAGRADWLLLGQGRASAVSAAGIAREAIFLVLVLAIVTRETSVSTVALCYLAAELAWSGLTQFLAGRTQVVCVGRAPRTSALLHQGWPIAIMGLMSLTYAKVDTPLLALMRGSATAGVYYSCYTLLFAAMGFAALFSKSALPELSKSGRHDTREIEGGARRLALLGALVGGGVGVVLSGSASYVLALVYGEAYVHGAPVLRVLAFCLPLHFSSGILFNSLVASGKRRPVAIGSTIAAVVNVSLNIICIPQWGMIGAAWATVASEATLAVAGVLGMFGWYRASLLGSWLGMLGLLAAGIATLVPHVLGIEGPALSGMSLLIYLVLAVPILRHDIRVRGAFAQR